MSRLDVQDFFHGAALIQIANHDQFSAINKARYPFHDGYYWVNRDILVYLKHQGNLPADSPYVAIREEEEDESESWEFKFSRKDLRTFLTGEIASGRLFFAGICGSAGVCLIESGDLKEHVVDENAAGSQVVTVTRLPDSTFQAGELTVLPKEFPASLFS